MRGAVLGLALSAVAAGGTLPRASATVLRSEQCTTGGFEVLRLGLELKGANPGTTTALLSKLLDVDRFDVARTAEELSRGKLLRRQETPPAPMLGRSAWATEDPDAKFFHFVEPGQQVRFGARQILIIVSMLTPGEYYGRARIAPWRESGRLGRSLRRKWRNHGELVLDRFFTEPFRIEIDAAGSMGECKGPPLLLPK